MEFGRRQFTEEIRRLQNNQQQLEDQVHQYAGEVDYYRSITTRCFFGLDKVLPVLEDLRKNTQTKIPPSWPPRRLAGCQGHRTVASTLSRDLEGVDPLEA